MLAASALLALGFSIGKAEGAASHKPQTPKFQPATLMGFYSPPMCRQDGGKADGPVSYCMLKDGYVIKFGDFTDEDCKTDGGRIHSTAWGKFCGLPSGYAVKIDMTTSHTL